MEDISELCTGETVERVGRCHHGRNITKIRQEKGIKQEALAIDLNMSQQTVSRLEKKRTIDDNTLNKVAKALNVPVEKIKEAEESLMNIIIRNNDFHDSSTEYGNIGIIVGDQANTNVDKILELQQENKELYERLVKVEQEKNEYLEKLVKKYEQRK